MSPTENIIPVLAGIIFNRDSHVLIARRNPGDSQEHLWEFPGGKLKNVESPEDCLKREFREEFNIAIAVERLFTAVNHSYSDKNILLLAYLGRFVSGEVQPADHQEYRWVPIVNLKEFDFSAADIPIVEKLVRENFSKNREIP